LNVVGRYISHEGPPVNDRVSLGSNTMLFGLYAPVPHVTVGSKEIAQSVKGALSPLPTGEIDPAFRLARDVLCEADARGFDLVLYAERHLGEDFEAWMLAAAVSSWTRTIRAMPAVHPGLWHPTLIAKMASSLDRLTPGRMAINLVTGWNEVEHTMYGGDVLLNNDDRYVRAEEFATILRGMWMQTPYSFEGRFYSVKESQLLLKPATVPPPEIFTASRSPRGLDMVAKYADWWFLDYDKSAGDTDAVMESLQRSIADMDRRAERHGRKVRYAFNPFIGFGTSDDAAIERTKRLLTPEEPDADIRKMMTRIGPAMKSGCIGRPEKVREQLTRYHDMGIELFLLKFIPTVEEVRMIADEIIEPLRQDASQSTRQTDLLVSTP
jgi:FMNH2-dependent dimethyl sulfone monooxygenase